MYDIQIHTLSQDPVGLLSSVCRLVLILIFCPFRFSVLCGKNIDRNLLKIYENLHVRISLGLERFKTKLVPVSSSPVWRETGVLPRQNQEDNVFLVELFAR